MRAVHAVRVLLAQVIRLCEGSGLYSALTYIHTAIGDFRKPLLDLLAAVAGAASWGEARRYAYKLLVFLRCCFRGLAFPPGTGTLRWGGGAGFCGCREEEERLLGLLRQCTLWVQGFVGVGFGACEVLRVPGGSGTDECYYPVFHTAP